MITDELLFNSVTIQLADMTTEAFLSPLFNHFLQAVAVILNVPKENIVIFSVQVRIYLKLTRPRQILMVNSYMEKLAVLQDGN